MSDTPITDAEPDDVPDDDGNDEPTGPTIRKSAALRRRRIAQAGGSTVSGTNKSTKVSLTQNGAAKRILSQQKRRDAIELRKLGLTYARIAEAVGYSSSSEAYAAVQKGFKEVIQEPAEELRQLQIERLNSLLMVSWKEAQAGSMSAINVCVTLMTRIDLLMGTEAPKQTISTTTNTSAITVTSSEDDFIASIKRFVNVQADGTNKPTIISNQQPFANPNANVPLGHVIPAAIAGPVAAPPARTYPPGMGKADSLRSYDDDQKVDPLEVMSDRDISALSQVANGIVKVVEDQKAKRVAKKYSVVAETDESDDED